MVVIETLYLKEVDNLDGGCGRYGPVRSLQEGGLGGGYRLLIS